MFIFSFMFLPLLITSFCLYYKSQKVVPVITIGLVSAILVSAFQAFFTFAHRVIHYSFSGNYVYLLFRQALLPVVILFLIFFFVSKDTLQFKIEMFLPLELSFYAIFLPYTIITTSEGLFSWYALFFKPVLFGSMLIFSAIAINYAYKFISAKKLVLGIIVIIAGLCYCFIPAVFETFYLLKLYTGFVIFGGLVYILLPVLLIVLKFLKIIKL